MTVVLRTGEGHQIITFWGVLVHRLDLLANGAAVAAIDPLEARRYRCDSDWARKPAREPPA